MKALILGITGFVGPFLARNLLDHGYEVAGTDFKGQNPTDRELPEVPVLPCDVLDPEQVESVFRQTLPGAVFHLAGFTSVHESLRNPAGAFAINGLGTLNVIRACLRCNPAPRLLFVSTANLYRAQPGAVVREDTPLLPDNPYAQSKLLAEQYVQLAARDGTLRTVIARPFNHTGPGQTAQFVVPALASQVAQAVQRPEDACIHTGDLSPYRDFTDVRDVVDAYRLCLEQGEPGAVYNVASGRTVQVRDLLDRLMAISGLRVPVLNDRAAGLKAEEARPFTVDISRIRSQTGWQAGIPLDKTLRDVLSWFTSGRRQLHP